MAKTSNIKIEICADHGGFELKTKIISFLNARFTGAERHLRRLRKIKEFVNNLGESL